MATLGPKASTSVLLFLFLLLVFLVAAGLLKRADGGLNWIVAQENFRIPVQIIEASRFWPKQPPHKKVKMVKMTGSD